MGISCKQATEYIIKKEEGKLTWSQRWTLWNHLVICRMCKLFNRQNKFINGLFKTSMKKSDAKLDYPEKEAIIKAMNDERPSAEN